MIVGIPVSVHSIEYRIASGRPFAVFEQLLMQRIIDGDSTLAGMQECFRVPQRLIIEALVSLFRSGWIGFAGHAVLPTDQGRLEFEAGLRGRVNHVQTATFNLIAERISGAVSRRRRFAGRRKLSLAAGNEQIVFLKGAQPDPSKRIEQYQCEPYLPKGEDQFIDSIVRSTMIASGDIFCSVKVDEKTGRILNLPENWQHLFSDIAKVLGESVEKVVRANSSTAFIRESDAAPTQSTSEAASVPEDSLSLVAGTNEHFALLRRALKEAESFVACVSFWRLDTLKHFEADLRAAVSRGVIVALANGLGGDKDSECRELLQKISWELRRDNARGQLLYSSEDSRSHAKILMFDSNQGTFVAVGSFNWLHKKTEPRTGTASEEISVLLAECYVTSGVVRFYMKKCQESWNLSSGRLDARLSAAIKRANQRTALTSDSHGNRTIKLRALYDQEHLSMMAELLAGAKERAIVGSHQVNRIAFRRAELLAEKEGVDVKIVYERFSGTEEEHRSMLSAFDKSGEKVERRPGFHSKVLVADDVAIVGSYNYLSTDVYETAERGKELSFAIWSPKLATQISELMTTNEPTSGE